jgi:hypothetical protein
MILAVTYISPHLCVSFSSCFVKANLLSNYFPMFSFEKGRWRRGVTCWDISSAFVLNICAMCWGLRFNGLEHFRYSIDAIPFLDFFQVECCKLKLTTLTNIQVLASVFGFISTPPLVLGEMWPRYSLLRRRILSSIYFYYIDISVI